MNGKGSVTMPMLVVLVWLLVVAVVGCGGSSTATSGTMMGSSTSGGMMYGTTAGTMMGSSTSVSMMGSGTTGAMMSGARGWL